MRNPGGKTAHLRSSRHQRAYRRASTRQLKNNIRCSYNTGMLNNRSARILNYLKFSRVKLMNTYDYTIQRSVLQTHVGSPVTVKVVVRNGAGFWLGATSSLRVRKFVAKQ